MQPARSPESDVICARFWNSHLRSRVYYGAQTADCGALGDGVGWLQDDLDNVARGFGHLRSIQTTIVITGVE